MNKYFWIVFFSTLCMLILWLFLNPSGHHRNTSSPQFPLYADATLAEAHTMSKDLKAPDYDRFSSLRIPPLSPEKALETFSLEEGFRIEIVAHEPHIADPIAMDIDPDGRLWVVEMTSFMPVHDQEEEKTTLLERVPRSRIVVLEDTTGDGRMDHSWTFMEGLILPRSVKVLDDGVLVAEPPNVWFIQDTTGDGIGDTKEIIYSSYGDTASYNVEHMTNGLMWGMDNRIYSAYSDVSLQRIDNGWKTYPFEPLAQWGITQDNWGRLYSAHNTRTLNTHLSPYGYSHRNPEFPLKKGIYRNIAERETMWPARPTGVNRGYRVNSEVREDGTLKRSTATTGPVIYRGSQYGKEYQGNAFVPEPAGNLIKRLINLDEDPGAIEAKARFAYEGREFLTSTDERFRPVNMYNAPDGSLYVVDMYRGIFQHARYLTDYLRKYAVAHDLHLPEEKGQFGRIYRIVREDHPIDYDAPKLSQKKPRELVQFLTHENGWIRDTAQQLLVQRSPAEVVPELVQLVLDMQAPYYTRLQALWTLDGMEKAHHNTSQLYEVAISALDDPHPRIRAAALRILEPELRRNSARLITRLKQMANQETEPFPLLQLLASLGESEQPEALALTAQILDDNIHNEYFHEMTLTGVYQREEALLSILRENYGWVEGESQGKDRILTYLSEASEKSDGTDPDLRGGVLNLYNLGKQQFQTCSTCHGNQGEGIADTAPSLTDNYWVNGNPEALIRIVLNGYEGSGDKEAKLYPGVMPAHHFMTDKEVAAVLTYIRQSWGNTASPIDSAKVAAIREATKDRNIEWKSSELLEFE